MSEFIPPRYELPLVDQKSGRISPEWYKFLVPLARKSVPSSRLISTTAPLSGGGDLSGNLTLIISANGITNAFLAKMAPATIKGNVSGTTTPADLTATQVTALLNLFSDTLQGLVPLSGGGTSNLMRSDGTWSNSVGASLTAATFVKTGAVTVASLPAAATAGAGARMMVTDATVTTFASVVVGGGANAVPVFSDATNWRIG